MTDLTVLVSPTPLLPSTRGLFGRRHSQISRPIMVTLESEIETDTKEAGHTRSRRGSLSADQSVSQDSRRSRSPNKYDAALLSPPVNTWKSPRTRHRPTRSQSAPPERRVRTGLAQDEQDDTLETKQDLSDPFINRPPVRSATSFSPGFASTRGGELVRPPPPLFRPTTFWRKTRRSGVTGASYSPSSHLIRRSTYIAAGLAFDAPVHDLSALGVESRVGFLVIPPENDIL